MECIDSDELNENIIMDKELLSNNVETINDSEFESNNNMMGMDSDEKRKEIKESPEINKILEMVKIDNNNPNDERMKNKGLNIIEEKPQINQGNQNFDVKQIFKPWNETEKQIKKDSHFKVFKSLSIVSFIIKANDDLRQEAMTMQLIKKYDELFKKENIPLKLHPYEIIVTSNSGGLIEFINDTISFDALKKKLLENNSTPCPLYSTAKAWAASYITLRPCLFAISSIASTSHRHPYT